MAKGQAPAPDPMTHACLEEEVVPRWKASVAGVVDGKANDFTVETGATRSCGSEEFLRQHPKMWNNEFRPSYGKPLVSMALMST